MGPRGWFDIDERRLYTGIDGRLLSPAGELAMTIQLKPEQEQRIAEAIRSGAYQSPTDVIDRALEVLHERDEWLVTNRQTVDAKIRKGMEELARWEGIPEDELDAHLTYLKAQPE
jgi:Arc/MetJ-type ribon-helix-helix transcriptional regulator